MLVYEYVLILADIVMDAGNFEASNEAAAEQHLINEIMPHFVCDRYILKEVAIK